MIKFSQALQQYGETVRLDHAPLGSYRHIARGTRPLVKFVSLDREDDDQQFYGMEMEIPFREEQDGKCIRMPADMAQCVYPFGSAYWDAGVEVVTCPATYKAQKVIVKRFFDRSGVGTTLQVEPRVGSGNHIHISTEPLGPRETSVIWEIVNTPVPAIHDLVSKVAQREHRMRSTYGATRKMVEKSIKFFKDNQWKDSNLPNTWAIQLKKELGIEPDFRALSFGKGPAIGMFRDMGDGTTHEIRIFQAPVNCLEANKNLDFVRSCIDFAQVEEEAEVYPAWLTKNSETYPDLHEFLRA